MNRIFVIFVFVIISCIPAFSQMPVIYPGFPLLLDSLHQSNFYGGYVIPLASDIDKDGNNEIIIASDVYNLRVIKTNGQNLSGFPKYYNLAVRFISCGDVDDNGFLDIVLRNDSNIIVLDKNGNTLNGFPVKLTKRGGRKFASLYDLDNDGKLELIADGDEGLFVFNYNGQLRASWPVAIPDNKILASPALGDIDNDGFGEIILSSLDTLTNNGFLSTFRHNGAIYPGSWPVIEDSAYSNFMGPPTLYIKQSTNDTTFICVPSNRSVNNQYTSSRLTKYGVNGNIIKRTNPVLTDAISQMNIGKLDNNIYFATGDNYGNCYLFSGDLNLVIGWPKRGHQYDYYYNVILGRVSSENNRDIIPYSPSADAYNGYGIAFGYNINGELQSWFPLRTYGLNFGHTFSDINNDGSIEYIHHAVQHGLTWLKIITIPGISYTMENYPWPVYGHDRWRTNQYGFIPFDDPIGIEPINNNIPKSFELHQNYPNPFNSSTIISFDIKKASKVKMIIYDVLGRLTAQLLDKELIPGSYRLSWNSAKFSSGVYFYELVTESDNNVIFREVRKAVIVK